MQAVPAAAGDGIIERKLQIVVAEKPVESGPCLNAPAFVATYPIRSETCRNGASGLNGLLIESRLCSALVIKALRSDRYKVVVGLAMLHCQEPIQRFQAGRDHMIVRTRRAHEQ